MGIWAKVMNTHILLFVNKFCGFLTVKKYKNRDLCGIIYIFVFRNMRK